MSAAPPGRLIAAGRSADIYELNDRWVLRRYRQPLSAEREAEIMTYARDHGYPVPAVREAHGTDLVMQRLSGSTMLDDIARRPWTFLRHARTLADLHRRLHAIPAPVGLPAPLASGDALIHRDLHPLNVILTPEGPTVIDWTNAARGDEAADIAETWILLAVAEVPGSSIDRLLARAGRGLFLKTFLSSFDRAAAAELVPAVAALRLADRNLTERERLATAGLAERVRRAQTD
jgi:aminoglycoside phosphotransferase (APT) family kinase protein